MRVQTLSFSPNSPKLDSYLTHVPIVVIVVVAFLRARNFQGEGEEYWIVAAVMWNPSIRS